MPSLHQSFSALLGIALTVVGIGCGRHLPPIHPTPSVVRTYVDLQPGWRVRVVTPILKSGKCKPDLKGVSGNGGAAELFAGEDFIGYETSYYRITPERPSGISIGFQSAVVTIQGKESRKSQPMVRLFEMPVAARYVRLVFLTRVSQYDHNQAIVAASEMDELNRLTDKVEADPVTNCRSEGDLYCHWVPDGIAVRAEKRDPANHRSWIPVS